MKRTLVTSLAIVLLMTTSAYATYLYEYDYPFTSTEGVAYNVHWSFIVDDLLIDSTTIDASALLEQSTDYPYAIASLKFGKIEFSDPYLTTSFEDGTSLSSDFNDWITHVGFFLVRTVFRP